MNQTTALTFAVDALATYRATRLVIDDDITRELREEALARLDSAREAGQIPPVLAYKLEYLLGCGWCVSIWTGAAVFALRRYAPDLADLINGLLAASAVTGILKSNEHRLIPE